MAKQNNKLDHTRNERQARRRDREKRWLIENGWRSWEALHTALMNGCVSMKAVITNSNNINQDRINAPNKNL